MYKPDNRYQWMVLPQRIKKSSTMSQPYVVQVLINVPKEINLIQYVDDLLLVHPDLAYLEQHVKLMFQDLQNFR